MLFIVILIFCEFINALFITRDHNTIMLCFIGFSICGCYSMLERIYKSLKIMADTNREVIHLLKTSNNILSETKKEAHIEGKIE